jgi:hypothetical protein
MIFFAEWRPNPNYVEERIEKVVQPKPKPEPKPPAKRGQKPNLIKQELIRNHRYRFELRAKLQAEGKIKRKR